MFDLLFFPIESSAFWQTELNKVPSEWIEKASRRGQSEIAKFWVDDSDDVRRKHRKKDVLNIDSLSFVHLSLMRLPDPVCSCVMERKGLARQWSRKYEAPELEIKSLISIDTFDAFAALCLLAKEGAEIGDISRLRQASIGARKLFPRIVDFPGCRRIGSLLTSIVDDALTNQFIPRRYNKTFFYGFGLPMTWRVAAKRELLENHLLRTDCDSDTEAHDPENQN